MSKLMPHCWKSHALAHIQPRLLDRQTRSNSINPDQHTPERTVLPLGLGICHLSDGYFFYITSTTDEDN